MNEEKFPRLADDDDLARARALWNEHGKSVVAGLALGLAGIVGFNYWQGYQQDLGESASDAYEAISLDDPLEEVRSAVQAIQNEYADTPYAVLASFMLARMQVEEDDLESARATLEWAYERSAADVNMVHVARVRLASVLIAADDPERALEILSIDDRGGHDSRYHELTGDAYVRRGADGDLESAREAYQSAIDDLPEGASNADILQMKLDRLGES